ncbi:J domain-containing protein [Marinobacter fonticola]|uniref:J domain-containing protein n=1 Tax=Marinobacter fonticola TaxID=2603215 RepID=UPI0011E85DD5|nr:J domain-containing protein [Marinobacter fonticola]
MTCWEVLGISPTNDRDRIEQAYESQKKFAAGDSLSDLDQARDEAFRQAGFDVPQRTPDSGDAFGSTDEAPRGDSRPAGVALNAEDQQVVREVVIQVDAMLNDSYRRRDPQIWRAILTEPPADQDHIREAVGDALYPRVKPHLDEGELPEPVVAFLAQWLGWPEFEAAVHNENSSSNDPFDDPVHRGSSTDNGDDSQPREKRQPMPNFWPAVIGWVAGLVILTSVFSNLLGS